MVPQVAGEDEVRLDDEMERVVWGEPGARLPNAAEPRRDDAAPPPYSHTLGTCRINACLPDTKPHSLWSHISAPREGKRDKIS